MSVEEVTAVEEVQVPSWQAAGIPVPWWEPAWARGWAAVLHCKETRDVVLGRVQQILVVAWVVLKHHAGAWVALASKGLGTWSPRQIGPMLVKAEETSTKRDTTMWVRELVVSPKRPYQCLMDADCDHVACFFCRFFCFHFCLTTCSTTHLHQLQCQLHLQHHLRQCGSQCQFLHHRLLHPLCRRLLLQIGRAHV